MPNASYDDTASQVLSHEFVYAEVKAALEEQGPQDVVATFDVGTHQMKGAQWYPVSQPRSFITSGRLVADFVFARSIFLQGVRLLEQATSVAA